jgi:hypothetical protein
LLRCCSCHIPAKLIRDAVVSLHELPNYEFLQKHVGKLLPQQQQEVVQMLQDHAQYLKSIRDSHPHKYYKAYVLSMVPTVVSLVDKVKLQWCSMNCGMIPKYTLRDKIMIFFLGSCLAIELPPALGGIWDDAFCHTMLVDEQLKRIDNLLLLLGVANDKDIVLENELAS